MRKLFATLTLALSTLLLAAPVQADDAMAGEMEMSEEMIAAIGAYMEAATPGAEHATLADWAGTYACTTRMRMDVDSDWFEYAATETIQPMMGGRFIHLIVKGDPSPMMPEGFEGAGILGYNNTEQRYEHTWVDTMGTMMLFMSGTADADGNITLEGSYTCPYMKETLHQRWIMKPTPEGFIMEIHGPDMEGNEFHMGTITAVRQ